MNLTDEQRDHIAKVGDFILKALDKVAQWADDQLLKREQSVDRSSNETAQLSILATSAEVRRGEELLRREPAIARVVVQWGQPNHDKKTFLFCRGGAAGAPDVKGVNLVSYRAPLGRLAEHEPGEMVTARIADKEHTGKIIERQKWFPIHPDNLWDAKDCEYEVEAWQEVVTSVRHFVENIQQPTMDAPLLDAIYASAEKEEKAHSERYRRAIIRIALRDQPILDRHQGEIFRMPVNHRILLLGPPGTGKTTTLIKRIAQKQTPSVISEEEARLVQSASRDENLAWVMYSPTELLTLYLKDAFNREEVPVTDQLKTWQRERRNLARNVIPILKKESRGHFREDEDATRPVLQSLTSLSISNLHDKFAEFHLAREINRCRDAIRRIKRSEEEESQELSDFLQRHLRIEAGIPLYVVFQRLLSSPDLLRTVEQRIQAEVKEWTDQEANRILQANPELLDQLRHFIAEGDPPAEDADDDDDTDDESQVSLSSLAESPAILNRRAVSLLISTLRTYAVSVTRSESLRGRAKEISAIIGELLPLPDTASKIGRRILLQRALRVLIGAPRRWVIGVAMSYSRFRREHPELYSADVADRSDSISGDELDVLILLSLRNARTIQMGLRSSQQPDWLSRITQSYVPQVYVDEATDFSAVQLAVLMELSHPSLRSWFACGDFRQRITLTGIGSESELRWIEETCGLESKIELKHIEIPYRQSKRMQEFSEAINPDLSTLQDRPQSAYQDDIPPLLLEGTDRAMTASWLAQRVTEIEKEFGSLPSIAVLVNGDDKIRPMVEAATEPFRDYNIKIVGCPGGQIVGSDQEIRVFDVRYIKGLEFEAVFFIDLDEFADVEPDLFHRFFYLGATRAATYLGITCQNKLPERLAPVRALFSEDGWS